MRSLDVVDGGLQDLCQGHYGGDLFDLVHYDGDSGDVGFGVLLNGCYLRTLGVRRCCASFNCMRSVLLGIEQQCQGSGDERKDQGMQYEH